MNECPVISVLKSSLTFHDRKAFGDMLALPFADGERDSLPSPEDLKYKILLKGTTSFPLHLLFAMLDW